MNKIIAKFILFLPFLTDITRYFLIKYTKILKKAKAENILFVYNNNKIKNQQK